MELSGSSDVQEQVTGVDLSTLSCIWTQYHKSVLDCTSRKHFCPQYHVSKRERWSIGDVWEDVRCHGPRFMTHKSTAMKLLPPGHDRALIINVHRSFNKPSRLNLEVPKRAFRTIHGMRYCLDFVYYKSIFRSGQPSLIPYH